MAQSNSAHRTYHRCCAEHITKAGGFVAEYMGDGVLAYFGYSQAREDDAERALRAGLALTEAVSKLPVRHGAAPQIRVGVATGLVVVGDLIGEGDARERGVVGDTANLAARSQALAEPVNSSAGLAKLGPFVAKGRIATHATDALRINS